MKYFSNILLLLLTLIEFQSLAQTMLAEGQQPQMTIDAKSVVRLVFGDRDKIYYSTSTDQGNTFTMPVLIGEVNEMHLGMTRGPQLATSKDYSLVTAIDKKGNIHSFRLTHKTGQWEKIQNVNDVDTSAPEGLMSVSADEHNNFFAVWLDLREDRMNNICFSSLDSHAEWSRNKFVYKSPDGHVCECCKPSIAVNGTTISIMFRNWLKGSRDLYLLTSLNGGQTFSEARKLGNGTWPLKGCPMDGGGLTVDNKNVIHTAWQRDGIVFYAEPGKPEEKIGEGRSVSMSGQLISWEKGSELIVRRTSGEKKNLVAGTALKVFEFDNKSILAVWEIDNHIAYQML